MLAAATDRISIARKCKFESVRDLYSKLSQDIHGYPWSADSAITAGIIQPLGKDLD